MEAKRGENRRRETADTDAFTGAFHPCAICATVMLNIGDSSIRCLEKNTDVHQQIQTLIVKTDHLALKLGSKK